MKEKRYAVSVAVLNAVVEQSNHSHCVFGRDGESMYGQAIGFSQPLDHDCC